MHDTLTRDVIAVSVGEEDDYYADFDPPDLAGLLLDGRTIASATAAVMDGEPGTVSSVEAVSADVTVNGKTIEAGTGVKFHVAGWAVRSTGRDTIVKVIATLSDGNKKPLGVRFKVEA